MSVLLTFSEELQKQRSSVVHVSQLLCKAMQSEIDFLSESCGNREPASAYSFNVGKTCFSVSPCFDSSFLLLLLFMFLLSKLAFVKELSPHRPRDPFWIFTTAFASIGLCFPTISSATGRTLCSCKMDPEGMFFVCPLSARFLTFVSPRADARLFEQMAVLDLQQCIRARRHSLSTPRTSDRLYWVPPTRAHQAATSHLAIVLFLDWRVCSAMHSQALGQVHLERMQA